uniref:Disease resistance protein At4g27190-like leucine-rich repeats domain-containing protein n=1 Tax=Oryza brachyantha TaxID=4533 RepID=J3N0T1_ORYBR
MLKYVHPFGDFTLPSLETLHITHCAHLRHIFPREAAAQHTVKEFKMLKHIYLDELPSLEGICEGCSMSAPKLQCVNLRGCSSLRHLPAVDCHPRPIVNCEKDCWDKLEWDGLEVAHHPSLYEMCQSSSYYKNPLPRGTLLRFGNAKIYDVFSAAVIAAVRRIKNTFMLDAVCASWYQVVNRYGGDAMVIDVEVDILDLVREVLSGVKVDLVEELIGSVAQIRLLEMGDDRVGPGGTSSRQRELLILQTSSWGSQEG